jgi:hypothetical protein
MVQHQDGETFVPATLLTIKAAYSPWRPAQRFWNSYQIYDPAVVFGVRIRSSQVAARFESDVRLLRDSKPRNWSDFLDKRKAAACIGLGKAIAIVVLGPDPDAAAALDLRQALIRFILTEAAAFAPAADDPGLPDLAKPSSAGSMAYPPAPLVRQLIELAGEHWVEALRNDARTFTLVSTDRAGA